MTMLIAVPFRGLLEWQRMIRSDPPHDRLPVCLCQHQRRRLHRAAERDFAFDEGGGEPNGYQRIHGKRRHIVR